MIPVNGVSLLQAAIGTGAILQDNRRNRVGVAVTEEVGPGQLTLELVGVVHRMGVST